MGKPTRCTIWSCRNKTDVEILVDDIYCYGLALDKSGFLYVSDWKKNEVRRWKRGEKNGTVVAGGNREERRLNQLSWPTFLFIDEDNSLFISDFLNHRVMKWTKDAKQGIVVAGGKDEGDGPNQLNSPYGLSFDGKGNLYVSDYRNNRIQKFEIDQTNLIYFFMKNYL